jgi:hypothetical protein
MGSPSLPPYAFVVVLVRWSCVPSGAGLGVERGVTTGERTLTGETFLTENTAACGGACNYGACLAHRCLSVLLMTGNKCHDVTY